MIRPTVESKLESTLAGELAEVLDVVPLGGSLAISPSADLCYSLELFLPRELRKRFPKWERESIDGIFVARATKVSKSGAEIAGTCILISDQSVTPFSLRLELSAEQHQVSYFQLKIGEPGHGPLGISGPPCNSNDAASLLDGLIRRLREVDWVFETSGGEETVQAG